MKDMLSLSELFTKKTYCLDQQKIDEIKDAIQMYFNI